MQIYDSIKSSNYVSLEEALEKADQLFIDLCGEKTRVGRKLRSVEKISLSERTRGNSELGGLEGFYIVNYAEDGFALLSADRRRPPVYAISNEGSLHVSDTTSNPGLAWYFNNVVLNGSVGAPPISGRDTTIGDFVGYAEIKTIYSEPLLKSYMAKFHQQTPYNKYCFTSDGRQALVGCVPLAMGTIMGFHEWPNECEGIKYDWSVIKQSPTSSGWCRLFEVLGRSNNLNVNYGTLWDDNGSSVLMSYFGTNVTKTFAKYGYSSQTKSFNFTDVRNDLENGRPVMCTGFEKINGEISPYGHTWIIDGGWDRIYSEPSTIDPGVMIEYYDLYYHCVWGEGGIGNGHYLYYSGLGSRYHDLDGNGRIGVDYGNLISTAKIIPNK